MARRKAGSYLTQAEFDTIAPLLTTRSQFSVYFALLSMRNAKTAQTHPVGLSLLLRKTGLHKTAVTKALNDLQSLGLIEKLDNGNRHRYRFTAACNWEQFASTDN